MTQKNVLYNVQKQKIKQTEVHLTEWISIKQSFLKKHIPIQQRLMKNLDNSAQLTMLRLRQVVSILNEEKQIQTLISQNLQKSLLINEKRFPDNIMAHSKVNNPKKQQSPVVQWSSNIDKVFNSLSNSHKKRILDSKQITKIIQKCQEQIIKQQARYQSEVKKEIKTIEKFLQKIDIYQKQTDSIVTNIKKDSKNKERDGNYYLCEYKKIQGQFKKQFKAIEDRAKQILNFMKVILDNQKACSKKLKQIFEVYFKSKNGLFKQNQFDQRFLGALALIQQNVAESRKQYFDKILLTQDQIEQIKTLVQEPNLNGTTPNLQVIVRYLKLTEEDYLTKLNAKNKLQFFSTNLSYKRWNKVSLAQGWIITTYLPVTIYLTYDNALSIFNQQNQFIKRVHLKQTRISKIGQGNVIFLEQIIKGFFSNSKEQYQIKFENYDSLEQFSVFIEHKTP